VVGSIFYRRRRVQARAGFGNKPPRRGVG